MALDWFTCYRDKSMSQNNADALAEDVFEILNKALNLPVQQPVAYEYGDDVFWHDSPDINDYIRANGKALVYASPHAEQPEPVTHPYGWHTEDHLIDKSATTYSKEVADRWKAKGWPVTPMYVDLPIEKVKK